MNNKILGLGIVALFILPLLVGCTTESRTRETLQKAGYSNITAGGYNFFECGKDDFYATKFTATNPVGQSIDGTVCCGLFFKGCTIRF